MEPPPGRDPLARLRGSEATTAEQLWNDVAELRELGGPGREPDVRRGVTREIRRVLTRLTASGGEVGTAAHRGEIGTAAHGEIGTAAYGRRAARHGARCARQRVPLALLLTAYESCFRLVQVALWSAGRTGVDALRPGDTERAARWLARVCEQAADGYAAELERSGRAREAVRALAATLLLGHRSHGLARCAGVVPASRYRVVVGVHPGGLPPWHEPSYAAALINALPVLHCEVDGALVLLQADPPTDSVPRGGSPAGPRRGREPVGDGLGKQLPALVGDERAASVHWGISAPAPVSRMAAALRQARATAEMAHAVDLPPGTLTRPSDIVVESMALRDPAVRAYVEDLGDVLGLDPDLMRTVGALYRANLDRGRTAEQLGIARRTLNSRLNRVQQLTGIGPTTSTGIQLLGLALAARRLAGTGRSGDPGARP